MPAASASPRQLLQYVLDDNLDAAIDAGLMDYAPQPGDATLDPQHPDLPQRLAQAQPQRRGDQQHDARAPLPAPLWARARHAAGA